MRMSSTYSRAAVPSNVQTNTGTADNQITLQVPALSNGVSGQFGDYLGRDPDIHQAGVNSADLSGVETRASGSEIAPQILGPSDGGLVSDLFDSYLGRNPDTGASTLQDFHFIMQIMQDLHFRAAGSPGASAMQDFHFTVQVDALPAVQVDALPAVQIDILPAVQVDVLPAVQIDVLPAVQVDVLPAVQVFATDWLV